MLQPTAVREPILDLDPEYLEFGVLDPRLIQKSIKIRITNTGGSILTGRFIPQVSWISISPPQFKCPDSQISEHEILLTSKLPRYWNQQNYTFSNLLLINSNVGSKVIGGSYVIPQRSSTFQAPPIKNFLVIPLIAIGIFALFLASIMIFNRAKTAVSSIPANPEISVLFTQGASTEFVRLTQKALNGQNASLQSGKTPIPGETYFFPETVTPKPTNIPSGTPKPTFTPWPRDLYQNPEQLIRDYYDAINKKTYQQSWSMLTEHFKEQCCQQTFGSEPFYIYSKWWETVDKVEVKSAFIQEWDKNPAQVVASLKFYFKDKNIRDMVQVYSIISDLDRQTLLIDEAQ